MFTRSVYLKLPFLGALFVARRSQARSGPVLSWARERGEWLLWAGQFHVIWTPRAALAAERAA